jgi:hypothetical protein
VILVNVYLVLFDYYIEICNTANAMKVSWDGRTDHTRSMIFSLRTMSLYGMEKMYPRTALPGRGTSAVDRGTYPVMISLTGPNLQGYSLIPKSPEMKQYLNLWCSKI